MAVAFHRVATHLENLEKSGNSKVVREKSGKMEKVRETEICFSVQLAYQWHESIIQLNQFDNIYACGPGLWICSSLTLL